MTSTWESSDRTGHSEEWDLDTQTRLRFGRYELMTKLGAGGMANVYLARLRGPRGFVKLAAVKCIHPHLAKDPAFVEMFLDEARIAAAIDHPNVCSAFDFGEVDGVYYLAMDYLAGEPWSEVATAISRWRDAASDGDTNVPRLDAPERHVFVARMVSDAAEGLHAAHDAVDADGRPLSVVHRDVSLPNLFLRYDGQVQVVDFGCAKAAGRIFQTEFGKVRGHIAYMAPEILRGWEADRRVDVWSLGVVLWELVTGERLFRRSAIHDTMFAIVSEEIRPPSAVAPTVPPELDRIALRALARDRDERYQTAREMADDLRNYVQASGIPMGLPQLAGFLDRLFPAGRERTQRLLEHVSRAREPSDPPPAPRPVRGARREHPTVRAKAPPPERAESTIELTSPTVIASVPPRSRRSWSPGWWPSRRVSPKSAFLGVGAMLTLGLGPLIVGGSEAADAAGMTPGLVQPARPAEPGISLEPEAVALPVEAVEAVGAVEPHASEAAEARDEAPEAKGPAPQPGRVNVITPGGWAEVRLGTRRLGPTPGQFVLPAGRHLLTFERGEGGARREVWVRVRSGEVSRVVVDDL